MPSRRNADWLNALAGIALSLDVVFTMVLGAATDSKFADPPYQWSIPQKP